MNFELLQSSYELYQNGQNYRDIAKHLGKSLGYASNLLTYFDYGTFKDVADVLVYKHYKTYALDEYIDIAEQMISNKIRIVHGVLQFRIQFNRLAALTKLRKDKGSRLEYKDLESLGWAGKAVPEHKPDRRANTKATPHSTVLETNDLTPEEMDLVTDKPRKFGRAVATPRAYHGKKVMRNKAVVEAKKQQARINQSLVEAEKQLQQDSVPAETASAGKSVSEEQIATATQQTTAETLSAGRNVGEEQADTTAQQTTAETLSAGRNVGEEQADTTAQQTTAETLSTGGNVDEAQADVTNQDCETPAQISKKAANKPCLFQGHPASKFLDSEGNYIGGGAGRPPFIDVYSEGFDKLPLEVQVASYQRFRELSKLRISFLKKAQALAKN